MNSDTNYVVVTDQTITAGGIIWWRMSGTVDMITLRRNWEIAGLDTDLLPSSPSSADALRRACEELREARLLMRPLGRGKGFAIVKETTDTENNTLGHSVIGKAELSGEGDFTYENCSSNGVSDAIGAQIDAAFQRNLVSHSTHDIAQWSISLLETLNAARLRARGGIYFVPRDQIELWQKYVSVIEESSNHKFFFVPALQSDEAVAAILDAVEQEAVTLAEQVFEETQGGSSIGVRALRGRQRLLESVENKIAAYEELLQQKSEVFPEIKEKTLASITAAIFALENASSETTASVA